MSGALGLIVGSGYAHLGFNVVTREDVETPYGMTSSPLLKVEIAGHTVTCVARHGESHSIAPHEVNYRANIWALFNAGVRQCVAINVVGAIASGFEPGSLAAPDQLIDYTSGREATFGGTDEVVHVDFSEPFDNELRGYLMDAVVACGYSIHRGTYGVTQGPRLETAAEIDRLERDGCAMVGMTAMPEAALAREVGVAYAVCALAVNHAAGRAPSGESMHAQIEAHLALGRQRLSEVLVRLVPSLVERTV